MSKDIDNNNKIKQKPEKRKVPLYYRIYFIFAIALFLLLGAAMITIGIDLISGAVESSTPSASGQAVSGQVVSGEAVGS